MPPHADSDSDWSESDDDNRTDLETSVLLGVPDGAIEKQEDLDDAAVSRMGGHPAFLTSTEPPLSSAQCRNCSFPMELLVQLWCPFEESTMDRALYIFGCARGDCQHKAGSVRAFRGLRHNAAYAAKLEKKRVRQHEKEAAKSKAKKEEDAKRAAARVNPFSMNSGSTISSGLFGATPAFGPDPGIGAASLGSHLFGGPSEVGLDDAPAPPPSDSEDEPDSEDGSEDGSSGSGSESNESVLAAPASTPSVASPWRAAPAYLPPLYLSTAAEYVPPPPKMKVPNGAGAELGDEGKEGRGKSRKAEARKDEKEKERAAWDGAMEGYEDSMEVDKVFERFARRVEHEGEQCIRYELGGTPLPYAHGALFTSLFPSSSSSSPQSKASLPAARRMYDARSTAIVPCGRCRGARVFECQLMPHLISALRDSSQTIEADETRTPASDGAAENRTKDAMTPEERQKEVERLLKHGAGRDGMEWGTCIVFSCEKDCCQEEAKEAWVEELVLVQWEE
ncbi:programmed cell death protein 2 [Phellopilus nigrolimitatus]|nr:programmed cell death protein 2 [Phellopilus nigrolimitatus]